MLAPIATVASASQYCIYKKIRKEATILDEQLIVEKKLPNSETVKNTFTTLLSHHTAINKQQ